MVMSIRVYGVDGPSADLIRGHASARMGIVTKLTKEEFLKCMDQGNRQIAMSMYSTLVEGSEIGAPSFFSPSRCNLIALFMRERVCLTVAPVATQPGRSGL
jgi:hypothetical protein